ncbi:MAG: nitroreductase family protein [Desulfobacterales bacterium]
MPGEPDVRRSCRNYKETPVPASVLEDLVRIGITAPSGTNSQMWTFTPCRTDRRFSPLGMKSKVLL